MKAVCALTDIPVLGARRFEYGGQPIAVFRTKADAVYAVVDACPHKGGPLSDGIVTEGQVACPLHGWQINLGTGCAEAPDVGCVKTFETAIREGTVWVNLS
jgi:nitrite reductase (NADH) small subunit